MRLKRLEMIGFKSFAEKTFVEFNPGVTAVVGVGATARRAEVLAEATLVAGPCDGPELLSRAGVQGWLSVGEGHLLEVRAPARVVA